MAEDKTPEKKPGKHRAPGRSDQKKSVGTRRSGVVKTGKEIKPPKKP
jgi:hypothetical protein